MQVDLAVLTLVILCLQEQVRRLPEAELAQRQTLQDVVGGARHAWRGHVVDRRSAWPGAAGPL